MSARDELIEIVARDPESSGGDPIWAADLVDAHRVEALNEGIAALQKWTDDPRRTRAAGLALAVGILCSVRDGHDSSAAPSSPDFFQPGHTYTDGNGYRAPEITTIFCVEHVTRHPDRGHLRAIGWMRTGETGSKWHGNFRDEGEFGGWTETTGEATR